MALRSRSYTTGRRAGCCGCCGCRPWWCTGAWPWRPRRSPRSGVKSESVYSSSLVLPSSRSWPRPGLRSPAMWRAWRSAGLCEYVSLPSTDETVVPVLSPPVLASSSRFAKRGELSGVCRCLRDRAVVEETRTTEARGGMAGAGSPPPSPSLWACCGCRSGGTSLCCSVVAGAARVTTTRARECGGKAAGASLLRESSGCCCCAAREAAGCDREMIISSSAASWRPVRGPALCPDERAAGLSLRAIGTGSAGGGARPLGPRGFWTGAGGAACGLSARRAAAIVGFSPASDVLPPPLKSL